MVRATGAVNTNSTRPEPQLSRFTCCLVSRQFVGQNSPDLAERRQLQAVLVQLPAHVSDLCLWEVGKSKLSQPRTLPRTALFFSMEGKAESRKGDTSPSHADTPQDQLADAN